MAAILTGTLSHREARVMLAVASGAWSAGSAARATGLDRAHCTRAIRSLIAADWLRRDTSGRVIPVDNPSPLVPEEHHLMVPQQHQGGADMASPPVPQKHHPRAERAPGADKAPAPEAAPVADSGEVVPKQHQALARARASGGCSSSTTTTTQPETLVFPRGFTPAQETAARRTLAGAGQLAQALLDELAGRMAIRPVANPLAYLRRLAECAARGEFHPEAGLAVAEARRREAERQKQRKESEDAMAREAGKRPPPPGVLDAIRRAARAGSAAQ
ncbi:MAG: hypothetical protein LC131_03755 [Anaerolineae bacterium]|nr:hypothetical protein [Rhodocyclaceae bacterium]MCZ2112938.1 hypothetical protein [Anaerolineae bacterium]